MGQRIERFLGGPPLATLDKLAFLSLVVGAIMAGFGLTPRGVVESLVDATRVVFGMGFERVRDFGGYALAGAMIVVPIWLVARLLGNRR